MDSVAKARTRLRAYPKLISACAVESAAYAACVARAMGDVADGQCNEEFAAFKKCVHQAAKKAGTRL